MDEDLLSDLLDAPDPVSKRALPPAEPEDGNEGDSSSSSDPPLPTKDPRKKSALTYDKRWIETRYWQVWMHAKALGPSNLLQFPYLHSQEAVDAVAKKCERALQALVRNPFLALGPTDEQDTGSATMWAILLVQDYYASLPEGWTVNSEQAQRRWDVEYMHNQLYAHRGITMMTPESEKTQTSYGKGLAQAAQLGKKTRNLDYVKSLGTDKHKKRVADLLHGLLLASGSRLQLPLLRLELPTVKEYEDVGPTTQKLLDTVAKKYGKK
tara:strand:- start:639 stop:1439 length:801 start_codon:yes stop_codon:yes gene_type:complete